MRSRTLTFAVVVALLVAACSTGLVGCAKKPTTTTEDAAGSRPPTAAPSAEPSPHEETTAPPAPGRSTAGPQRLTLTIYLPREDKLGAVAREVPYTRAVATAAITELLKGPSPADAAHGFHTEIPEGTELRSVSIRDGIATVDLTGRFDDGGGSLSMFIRLAQLVFTVTQFKSVDAVVLKLDGTPVEIFSGEGIVIDKPMRRSDFEDVLPAIFVEKPLPGATSASPLKISGTANVLEAAFKAEVRDASGAVVGSKTVTAASGTGTRGSFADSIPFAVTRTQMGSLVVFVESPRDGSRTDVVTIPVKLVP